MNIREELKNVEWIREATEKEIEDEILILNEELDEIGCQIRNRGSHDYEWYRRAVHASKVRRARLRLIRNIAGNYTLLYSGDLKHKFDCYERKIEALNLKLSRANKRRENKEDELVKARRVIKKLKKNLERNTSFFDYLKGKLDSTTLKAIRKDSGFNL